MNNIKMNNLSFVAGHDSNGIIHDYVVYMIKSLSIVSDVYYCCDNDLPEKEVNKISQYVKWVGYGKHRKYDFGSWKRIIDRIGWAEISKYEKLILINDSVYGPIYDIKHTLNIADSRGYALCGLTKNRQISEHVQSYFMIANKDLLFDNSFRNFWGTIKDFKDHESYVIDHEVKLSRLLINNGYKIGSIVENFNQYINPTCFPLTLMRNHRAPFIKIKCFRNPDSDLWEDVNDIESEINQSSYDFNYISSHLSHHYLNNLKLNSKKYYNRVLFISRYFVFYINHKNKLKIVVSGRKILSIYTGNRILGFLLKTRFNNKGKAIPN